jgi:hypothetical protein
MVIVSAALLSVGVMCELLQLSTKLLKVAYISGIVDLTSLPMVFLLFSIATLAALVVIDATTLYKEVSILHGLVHINRRFSSCKNKVIRRWRFCIVNMLICNCPLHYFPIQIFITLCTALHIVCLCRNVC